MVVREADRPAGHAAASSGRTGTRPRRAPALRRRRSSAGRTASEPRTAGTRPRSARGRSTGRPRKRSGNAAPSRGKGDVCVPCCSRVRRSQARSAHSASEIMARIGEVEALVAERKIGDLVARHRQRERGPVVERRIDHLVAADPPGVVGEHRRATISPRQPSSIATTSSPGRARRTATRSAPRGSAPSCSIDELERALDLEPAHERARVARRPPTPSRPGCARSGRRRRDGRAARRARPRTRARPDRRSPSSTHVSRGHHAHALEPRLHRRVPNISSATGSSSSRSAFQPVAHLARHRRRDVERDAARPDQTAAVAIAGERHEQVQALAAHAARRTPPPAGTRRRPRSRRGRRCGWPAARARARCRGSPAPAASCGCAPAPRSRRSTRWRARSPCRRRSTRRPAPRDRDPRCSSSRSTPRCW